jgi:type II secretory ATPase GspE/PulE/Tfp pilus assembly ATPase PilB-like protein
MSDQLLDAKLARRMKLLVLSKGSEGVELATPLQLEPQHMAELRERFGAKIVVKPITETEFFALYEKKYRIVGIPSLEYHRAVKYRAIVIDLAADEVTIASPSTHESYAATLGKVLRKDRLVHHPVSEAGFQELLDRTYPRPYGGTTFALSGGNGVAGYREPRQYALELLEAAVNDHVTDIHFERTLDGDGRIRMRRDRFLFDAYTRHVAPELLEAMIRIIRSEAKADPVDPLAKPAWRLNLPSGRDLDTRLQFMPGIRGEELAIRLMGTGVRHFALDELGMTPSILQLYQLLLSNRTGGHMVVGPVNAGKSTTQRAVAHETARQIRALSGDRASAKMVSIEKPVEIQDDYTQLEIDDRLEIKHSTIVSSLVRMDYDLAIIAEINDAATANAFFDAGMAGRMLIASFHAMDSVTAIMRLLDMGVRPTTIQTALKSILYQRLISRLCQVCRRQEMTPPAALAQLRMLYENEAPKQIWTQGNDPDCEKCGGIGYDGMYALFELLPITHAVGSAIALNQGYDAIHQAASDDTKHSQVGYLPMAYSALDAVKHGFISYQSAREAISLR